jgi:hypothetical protein
MGKHGPANIAEVVSGGNEEWSSTVDQLHLHWAKFLDHVSGVIYRWSPCAKHGQTFCMKHVRQHLTQGKFVIGNSWQPYNFQNADIKGGCRNPCNIKSSVSSLPRFHNWSFDWGIILRMIIMLQGSQHYQLHTYYLNLISKKHDSTVFNVVQCVSW